MKGNCISDIDCKENLICQVRSEDEEVPGCDGQGGTSINYCRYPDLTNLGNNPESSYPLGQCEGELGYYLNATVQQLQNYYSLYYTFSLLILYNRELRD